MIFSAWLGSVEQGLLWGAMVLGVYLTFRVLDFPDLTIDGSFTLGAAVVAQLILSGHSPFLSFLAAVIAGSLAGLATGLLHTQLKIAPLLSGILIMIALYSINLRIMGQANLSLLRTETVFTWAKSFWPGKFGPILIGFFVVVLVGGALYLFLKTELGMSIRATGNNERMIRSLGVNTNNMKMIGLAISNALVALSGGLIAQYQGFADIGMGIGMIIVGLASVIIGESLISSHTLIRALFAALIGSLLYRAVITSVLQLGMPPTDLKLLTASIVIIAMALPILRQRLGICALRLRSGKCAQTGKRSENF